MALPYISELRLFIAILTSAIAIFVWLGIAAFMHDRRRRAVPMRIHVAGSRGKTTTTRLIAAALRASGRRVLAKTTGTDPMLILPDGSERAWRRWGPPSISEQVRFFREARRHAVDAVVLESMAIEPEYLWASEEYLVQATHTVVTNVRPDHEEVVGDHPLAAAHAMSLVVPRGKKLFISDEAATKPILSRATQRGCEIVVVPTVGLQHDEANRALALKVCTSAGVEAETASGAFARAGSDPGAFFLACGMVNGRSFRFANAFSCNDARSLEQLQRENPSEREAVVLLNVREDRPERTRTFLSYLAGQRPPVRVYVAGWIPMRWVRAAGLAEDRVHLLRTTDPRKVLSILASAAPIGATIWGVGNYSRLGRDIVHVLRTEARPC